MKLVKKKISFSKIYYTVLDEIGNKVENEIKSVELQTNKVTDDNAVQFLKTCVNFENGVIPVVLKVEKTEKVFQCTLEDFLKIATERMED